MNTCDVITGARQILDKPERWARHKFKTWEDFEKENAQFCLIGACRQAAADLAGKPYEDMFERFWLMAPADVQEVLSAAEAAELALGEVLDRERGYANVAGFNDSLDTEFGDIQEILEITEKEVCE